MISLDEQIAFTTDRANAPLYRKTASKTTFVRTESARHHHSAILASLKELKRIKELMREPTIETLTEMAYLLAVVPRGKSAGDWLPTLNRQFHAANAALIAQVEREMRDES
jgi:hypothetical protein